MNGMVDLIGVGLRLRSSKLELFTYQVSVK